MKTHEYRKTTEVLLMDGKSRLATWTQEFEKPPTVGERVKIPAAQEVYGFGDHATVSRIVWDHLSETNRLEAQAECELPDHRRPEVFVNASMIPDDQRAAAEECLRSELHLPLIHWEESTEPKRILRLLANGARLPATQESLQAMLRDLAGSTRELSYH